MAAMQGEIFESVVVVAVSEVAVIALPGAVT